MPHRPDAPDVVIPCRAGENRELRFALRSIEHSFDYRHIWIVGGWPDWLDTHHERLTATARRTRSSKYATTRAHYRWACQHPQISDPWVMWNDDMFCLTPTHELPAIHRGPMKDVLPLYHTWQSKWANGMRETDKLMRRLMPHRKLYCYDLHTPITVDKQTMLRALELAESLRIVAPHVRTLYGNLARLGGTAMRDPKIYTHRPGTRRGGWLSSEDRTFTTAVEPQLIAAGLRAPSPFELPGVPDRPGRSLTARARDPRTYRAARYRVLNTPDGAKVMRTAEAPAPNSRAVRERRQEVLARHVTDARREKAGCLSCGR